MEMRPGPVYEKNEAVFTSEDVMFEEIDSARRE
jgi:hypothetical protein